MYDVIIIGGGAGGMVAAIKCAERGKKVLLLEKNDKLGKKLLATGNGHCNMGNVLPVCGKYNTDFVESVLSVYDIRAQREWFASLGLLTKVDENRVYPYSMQAATVSNILREALDKYGVEIRLSERVTRIERGFVVNGKYRAPKVILATGGIAVTGEDGNALVAHFGHVSEPEYPALVPLITDSEPIKGLRGVRAEVGMELNVLATGVTARDVGEVIFKDNGISGTAVFALSSVLARAGGGKAYVVIDFMPEYTEAEVADIVKRYGGIGGLFHKEISKNIMRHADGSDCGAVAHAIKNYRIDAVKLGSYELAQVSVGGLRTSDFDPQTLESKLVRGLYAIGEALDVDGECGGFNLMWAFGSAMAVGDNV